MSDFLNLEVVDVDGAVREAAEAAGIDRSDFIKRGVLAGGGLVASGALFNVMLAPAEAAISSKRSSKNDDKILNFALTLEYLESTFYRQALQNNAFSSDLFKTYCMTVGAHEDNHVAALKVALRSKAIKSPTFDFGKAVTDPATFAATAQVLEDTGVKAYLGQVPNVKSSAVLKAAGEIVTVEARHAAWIRFLNGSVPAPVAFDTPQNEKRILKAVGDTGFIKG